MLQLCVVVGVLSAYFSIAQTFELALRTFYELLDSLLLRDQSSFPILKRNGHIPVGLHLRPS
jgi:hypothetical protein